MLVSSPSMYCTTTGVNSSRKAVWNLPSFMVAAGRKGQCGGQGYKEGQEGRGNGGRD